MRESSFSEATMHFPRPDWCSSRQRKEEGAAKEHLDQADMFLSPIIELYRGYFVQKLSDAIQQYRQALVCCCRYSGSAATQMGNFGWLWRFPTTRWGRVDRISNPTVSVKGRLPTPLNEPPSPTSVLYHCNLNLVSPHSPHLRRQLLARARVGALGP